MFAQRLLGLVLSGKESGLLVSNALLVFARLLLQHQAAFEQLLSSAAADSSHPQQQQQQAGSPEAVLMVLVGVWCDAFDSIAQPLARKLAACGLAALLAFPVEVGGHSSCSCSSSSLSRRLSLAPQMQQQA